MSEYNKDRRPMELEPAHCDVLPDDEQWDTRVMNQMAREFAYRDKQIAGLRGDAAIGRMVRLKMTSGNSAPVDRCTVTAAEIGASIADKEHPNA